jgi:hypothetical protein
MELIHRNLAIGIHDALQETFFEKNKYADKVIERLLKANKNGEARTEQLFLRFSIISSVGKNALNIIWVKV